MTQEDQLRELERLTTQLAEAVKFGIEARMKFEDTQIDANEDYNTRLRAVEKAMWALGGVAGSALVAAIAQILARSLG